MPNTHLSPSKSRRDLAASLRGSRNRKHARLRHRRLQAERLEDRQLLATISGAVFNDLNANGLKDGGESGQSGWTVYLDADGNGQLSTGETSRTTAANGSYSFGGLVAGTYTVAEVQQPGWQQTSPVGSVPSIERVNVANDGTQGNGSTFNPYMSADGNYAVFTSSASNLVPGDTNGTNDTFVYDRQANTIERVSVAANGTQGNQGAEGGSLSADGRYVAFSSFSSNLVPGDTNGACDVFVYDRQTHTIERVSVASDGTQGTSSPEMVSISADGRYVAFVSGASNLVPDDTNGAEDVFVFDRQEKTIQRVSVANGGTDGNGSAGNPTVSADGRYVGFSSTSSNLVPGDTNGVMDVFVVDRQADTIERVSLAANGTQANNGSTTPKIGDDGRYVAFYSTASNLVPGDTNGFGDTFVYDRQTDAVQRVSLAADGSQGNGYSSSPTISADGRYVGFLSNASNLVPGDTNGVAEAFVTANPFAWASGCHVVALAAGQNVSGIDFGNTLPALPTKFYVVNDATQNLTYEYNVNGGLVESYSLNSGNTAPRGAASTIAGDKTWVVDANRKVYVYNNSGGLLGSWTAGTLATTATVEGIATNGTDVWIVDAKSDKVYKYAGAATRVSGSQNAASSFSLNSGNTSPKDIVAGAASLWVVNDSTTDKVFKYTTAGSLISSWTITTPGATSPTGITIDPANVTFYGKIWIVDSGTDRVYEYNAAASLASGSSKAADVSFALAAGNTNPQGIADPPAPSSLLVAETPVLAAEAALCGNDAALENMYYEPLKTHRVDTVRRSESRTVESHTRDLSYTVGASANRLVNDSMANDTHHTEVDDLFAQWDSDPLELLSIPDLGA